jgi:hypothetical protein
VEPTPPTKRDNTDAERTTKSKINNGPVAHSRVRDHQSLSLWRECVTKGKSAEEE